MKNNDFNSLGMAELTIPEQYAIDGGSIKTFLACIAAAMMAIACIDGDNHSYNQEFAERLHYINQLQNTNYFE